MIEGLRDLVGLAGVLLAAIGLGRELRTSLRRYHAETASPAIRRESRSALLRPAGVAITLSAVVVLGFVLVFL